jgi:hypothetical protein
MLGGFRAGAGLLFSFYVSACVNQSSRGCVSGGLSRPGLLISINSSKYLTMNKILAALAVSLFAAGAYATDAAKPATAAASAAPAAKADKKAEAKPAEAKTMEAKPAAPAAPAASAAKK